MMTRNAKLTGIVFVLSSVALLPVFRGTAQTAGFKSPFMQISEDAGSTYENEMAAYEQAFEKLRNGETLPEAERIRCSKAPGRYFDAISKATGLDSNIQFPEPQRTQFYKLAVLSGIFDWENQGGWAFRADIRMHVLPRMKTMFKENPDPVTAFGILFPALQSGDRMLAQQMMAYLFEHDQLLARKAMDWTYWSTGDSTWFIDIALDNKQPDLAQKMASQAMALKSLGGMEANGYFLTQAERFAEAEACYKEIEKQHEYIGDLIDFYQAHPDKTDNNGITFRQRYDELLKQWFPDGLRKVRPEDFSTPPDSGVVFMEDNPRSRRAGLTAGTVIVALDGYAVENLTQYFIIRQLDKDNPRMEMIIWNGTEYKPAAISLPNRRFGLDIQTYPPSL